MYHGRQSCRKQNTDTIFIQSTEQLQRQTLIKHSETDQTDGFHKNFLVSENFFVLFYFFKEITLEPRSMGEKAPNAFVYSNLGERVFQKKALWHIAKAITCGTAVPHWHSLQSWPLYFRSSTLTSNAPENSQSIWTHVEDPEEAHGFWFQNSSALVLAPILEMNHQMENFSLSSLSPLNICLTSKQMYLVKKEKKLRCLLFLNTQLST